MKRVAVVLAIVVVALLAAGAATAEPVAFVADGFAVSTKKIHFGTVTIGSCSFAQLSGCTVSTVTVTNTSSVPFHVSSVGEDLIGGSGGEGIGVGLPTGFPFPDLGTCEDLLGVGSLAPGDSCTFIATAGYASGLPGHYKDVVLVLNLGGTIAELPVSVKNVS
jgi:hypothetical protein